MSFDAAVGVYTAFDDWTLAAVWLDCWCHLPQICDWFPPNQIPLVYHTNQTASSINYNSVIVFFFISSRQFQCHQRFRNASKFELNFRNPSSAFLYIWNNFRSLYLILMWNEIVTLMSSVCGDFDTSIFEKSPTHTSVCNNKRNFTIIKIVPSVQLQQTIQQHWRPVSCLPLSFL